MANVMRGAAYQVTQYKDKVVGGERFLLMAKCDWVRAGTILDCKRVDKYADVGKYFDSVQHAMYLEVIPTAREFKYEICDGEDIYEERYTRFDIPETIEQTIWQFMESLKKEGLWELYKEKWITYYYKKD